LGNETFYILALPFTFWAVNMVLLRQLILLWAVTYYVGQTLKVMPFGRPADRLSRSSLFSLCSFSFFF
jgi:hypothetical protein